MDRYQSGLGQSGVMDTEAWFAALPFVVPLGSVLDVGCAEGVMCALALDAGATSALGIDTNADRIAIARQGPGTFEVRDAGAWDPPPFDTVILSQILHWIGPEVARRYVAAARRNLGIIFRPPNDGYQQPANGTWFPTLDELDALIPGVRTSETLLLEQDAGKQIWAATYRTDLVIHDGVVVNRAGRVEPLRSGFDLHGDQPFRPTQGRAVVRLSGPNATAVRDLARRMAQEALADGTYPSDFSPRNVIVAGSEAWLIDDNADERMPGTVVAPEFLPIWQATLSSIGLAFDGDLRSLL